ncbi:SemiSWEET transporter [Bacteroidota bacterium]
MSTIAILGYIAAFCTTLSFVPQAAKVIKTKETKAISLPMYLLFNVGIVLWLIYGIMLNEWPIILANAITISLTIIILTMKIKHG